MTERLTNSAVRRALRSSGRSGVAAAFALAMWLAGSSATAGDCRPCTMNSECGVDGICVEWIGAPACSGAPRSCCPGQGCAVMGGVPSCVATGRCRVATGGGGDGGANDAGMGPDTGTGSDSGGGTDSGGGGDGGGTGDGSSGGDVAGDGGGTTMRAGCGCRVVGEPANTAGRVLPLALTVGALVAFARLRPRRRR